MTATHPPSSMPATPARADRPDARRRLRTLVRADAALAAASGVLLLVAGEPLSELAGLDGAGPARIAGVFLVLLGLDLAWLGLASDAARQRWVPISAAGDLLWAAGSLAIAVLADLTWPGRILVAAQGLLVLAVGEAKLVLLGRARREP